MVSRVLVIGFTALLAGCGSVSGEASVASSSGRTADEYCLALEKVDSALANYHDSIDFALASYHDSLEQDENYALYEEASYKEASEKYAVSLIEASAVAPADHVDGLIAWASAFDPYIPFDNPKLKDTDFWQGLSEEERTDWGRFYEAAIVPSSPVWEYGSEQCGLKHPAEYETPVEENFVTVDESDAADTTPKDDAEDTTSFSAIPAS